MKSIEDLLQQMSLRQPSEQLDQRIIQALSQTPTNPKNGRRVPAWCVTLAASAACLFIGISIGQHWRSAERQGPGDRASINDLKQRKSIQSTQTQPGDVVSEDPSAERHTIELAQAAENEHKDGTSVSDGTFVLINGRFPARWHRAITSKRVRVFDSVTRQSKEVAIPIRRDVMAPSPRI